ncbi:MAG: S9 family peptidase [Planctomycetaceae bacterium]|nr:S9 family peptidase [Planctomycetaceae bacterium]
MQRFILAFLACSMVHNCMADDSGYQLPPQEVVDIIDAPPEPAVSISPDGEWLLLVERDAMPSIEDLARRKLQIGGIRIDPAANGQFRVDYARGISVRRRDGDQPVRVPLGEGAKLASISWAHTSRAFLYTLVTPRGTELWSVDIDRPGEPRRLTERLSTVLGGADWMPDGKHVICRLTPESRGAEPPAPPKPLGPNIQESSGNVSPTRTFQDLLTSPHDEALFAYHITTQLAILGLDGSTRLIGAPAMIDSAEPSPDGLHLLMTIIKRPFSYTLPYHSFAKEIVVWDLNGKPEYKIVDLPVEENIPIEGVRTGPRSIQWTSSDPATLVWYEALDGGDPRQKVPHRDRLMAFAAPFSAEPRELHKIEHRAVGVSYFHDRALLAVTEYDRDRRWIRTLLHNHAQPQAAPKVLTDRSIRDAYGDPGDLVPQRNAHGHSVARQDGPWVYLSGAGASPQGYLPFLDRQNLDTLATERLWRCEVGQLESVAALAKSSADAKPTIITRRESSTTPQNYLLRDLQQATIKPLTDFRDPVPQIRGIRKELITYKRADGVPLSATLYLPADYKPGTRLPLFIWAYPVEFSDASTAGQVTTSPNQFTRIRGASHLTLVTQGYAVMDNATMPVVGEPETMNDTFVEQIVSAAQAAIDKAVEMGVADRNRVAIGGHSYGGFMTANLLAHCDLFRAGVARSGAYNRTLTPFGFQAERRPFWQAQSIYMNLSPFTHADKIKEPILLIHGENDNNAGTFPLQSQRMFQAIKGNGGTVRLVMLPHESHGYSARESVLHVQAETIAWLNRYVRDAKPASGEK